MRSAEQSRAAQLAAPVFVPKREVGEYTKISGLFLEWLLGFAVSDYLERLGR